LNYDFYLNTFKRIIFQIPISLSNFAAYFLKVQKEIIVIIGGPGTVKQRTKTHKDTDNFLVTVSGRKHPN
jgi:hypothetical protein